MGTSRMADPDATGIALYVSTGVAAGGIIAKAIAAFWKFGNKGKEDLIDELRATNAVTADRLKRSEETVTKLGDLLDIKKQELSDLKERFAAHVIRTDDYGDVPTGVHHLAATLDPSKPTPR